jgi:cytochrome c-type biogenesis protein CcmF
MIPELGSFAIIIALWFAMLQGFLPLLNYWQKDLASPRNLLIVRLTKAAIIGQFSFLVFAMAMLIFSFIANDLTLIYVREHSHHLLPFIYRVGAAWGGHEGSLLLWCVILSGWTCAFLCFRDSRLPEKTTANIHMILGMISCGFILFLFFTSNPFLRNFPQSFITGDDLTPVLQDPGLIFHPPMLYLGYVGFALTFAFAISALLEGKLDTIWAQACRPWLILPWACLSLGIVLGSWWAYRELGWGGWWFWDPVENASLLPWLAATALLHSLIVSDKRQAFQGWTILLAIITFTLSLLGTFLVRSGVLVSVHAFANDPTRGLFLLCYLAILICSAFIIYAVRIKHFYRPPTFALLSRETFLLLNSVILLICVVTIVIGTLYPILLDALNADKISVGEPYFNTVFLPIILPLLFLMGVAPHVHWHEHPGLALIKKIYLPLILSFLSTALFPWVTGFDFHLLGSCGIFLGFWIIFSTCQYLYKQRQARTNLSFMHASMVIAHVGIAIMALGVSINKTYSTERQLKIAPGESTNLAGYKFHFDQMSEILGSNYNSITSQFTVQKNNFSQVLISQQRIYKSHEQTLSKPGILANMWRDLYLTLGNSLPDGSWSIRIYYKPCVRWIWFGGVLLLVGGLVGLFTDKKRKARDCL